MTTTLDAAIESVLDDLDQSAPAGTSTELPTPPQRPAAPVQTDAAEALLAAGRRSRSKRTKALADKITAQLIDLRTRLLDDVEAERESRRKAAEQEAAKAEVVKLERALAAAKARLKKQPGGVPRAAGNTVCTRPDCGREFATPQARAMHERRAHDGFNPHTRS